MKVDVGWPCVEDGTQLPRLRYSPIPPSPKQAAFLMWSGLEALYGGAGGGGKSVALLMAALQFADVPGYNALILRRSLTDLQLPDGLIDVSHDWLRETGAKWNGNRFRWTFPSGAVLQFGYMAMRGSERRYKSSQFQFIGWDELTEFPWEEQYRYLFSRLRLGVTHRLHAAALYGMAPDGLTLAEVPLRVRAATNPGGPGHDWVYRRFVDRSNPERRPFLKSLLADNPGINADDYRRSLAELPEVERRRLEDGDWSALEVPGALWSYSDIHRFETVTRYGGLPISEVDVRVVAVDPSVSEARDECGIVVGALKDGIVHVEEDLSGHMHPDTWAKLVVRLYHERGASRLVVEGNQGGDLVVSAVNNAADVLNLRRPHVVKVHAVESKEARAVKVAAAYRADPPKVLHSVQLRAGRLENQMTSWVAGPATVGGSGYSPDRLDALVWLVRHLLFAEGDSREYRSVPVRRILAGEGRKPSERLAVLGAGPRLRDPNN